MRGTSMEKNQKEPEMYIASHMSIDCQYQEIGRRQFAVRAIVFHKVASLVRDRDYQVATASIHWRDLP